MTKNDSSAVDVPETRAETKGKAPLVGQAHQEKGGMKKGVAIFDFVLRIAAIVAALVATSTMGTSEEILPFFTQFFQFHVSYNDLPTFTFFVIAIAVVAGYLILSLPLSIICIVRPHAPGPRLLLLILDTVVLTLDTAASAASIAIVYLAHNGNANSNWLAICNQFGDFCQSVSSAVVASLISALMLLVLVIMSGLALKRL